MNVYLYMKIRNLYRDILPLSFRRFFSDVRFYFCRCINILYIVSYRSRINNLKRNLFSKEKISVVFFVENLSMWKYNELFDLFYKEEKFNPKIIFVYNVFASNDVIMKNQNDLKMYFKDEKYSFVETFSEDTYTWMDIRNSMDIDIVFYMQPYDNYCYKIKDFRKSLFVYIPYSFWIVRLRLVYDLLLCNIAWKLFYPTNYHLDDAKKLSFVKGLNVVVSGHPVIDELLTKSFTNDPWKIRNKNFHRIIWAPHHSILDGDAFFSPNFLVMADAMLQIAFLYRDRIQFAFKPHPYLKSKLYTIWGKEKTDSYYEKWALMPNSILHEGGYVDLFKTSDAMIHDCISFAAEYLCVNKPVLFMVNNNIEKEISALGEKILSVHYKALSIDDVYKFISLVLFNEDVLFFERSKMVNDVFRKYVNSSKIIFDTINEG